MANELRFGATRKGLYMSNSDAPKNYRSKDEWFAIIQEARKSGMTDAQWCLLNGVNRYSFNNALKRLRKCSYAVPTRKSRDIHDLTVSNQEVVKVNIVPEVQLPEADLPAVTSQLDNSHMIEITIGDIHIDSQNDLDNGNLTAIQLVNYLRISYLQKNFHRLRAVAYL